MAENKPVFSTFGNMAATEAPTQEATTTNEAANAAPSIEPTATNEDTSTTVVNENGAIQENNAATQEIAGQQNNTTGEADNVNAIEFTVPDFEEKKERGDETTQSPVLSAKDAVAKLDRNELLKELGLDEFEIGLHEHRKNGGKTEDYLNAKSVDWNTVSDIDILKAQLKKDFPEATTAQIERLLNKKYNQTETADDEDKEDGLLLMKADARKARQAEIANQEKFKIADRPQPAPQAENQTQQIPPELDNYVRGIVLSKSFQDIKDSKRVAIPLPDGTKLNMSVSQPDYIMQALFSDAFQRKLNMQQGAPDVEMAIQRGLMMLNPKAYIDNLYNAGVRAGERQVRMKEGQNVGIPSKNAQNSAQQISLKEEMKGAKLTTFGNMMSGN